MSRRGRTIDSTDEEVQTSSDESSHDEDDDDVSVEPTSSEDDDDDETLLLENDRRSRDIETKEEGEDSAVQRRGNYEFEPLDISDEDVRDSDTETGDVPLIYRLKTPLQSSSFFDERRRLNDDVRLRVAEEDHTTKDDERRSKQNGSDDMFFKESAISGGFVRVRSRGAKGEGKNDLPTKTEEKNTDDEESMRSQRLFESLYSCAVNTGLGLLAGLSLAILLLLNRFDKDDESFLAFYTPWSDSLRSVHLILQSLFCCDVLNVLLFRTRLSDDELFSVDARGASDPSSSSRFRDRWQRSRSLDILFLWILLVLMFASLFLSGIMGKMDATLYVRSEDETVDVANWGAWLSEDGNLDTFTTWKDCIHSRAVFLLVAWCLYNIVLESQRYMDNSRLKARSATRLGEAQ